MDSRTNFRIHRIKQIYAAWGKTVKTESAELVARATLYLSETDFNQAATYVEGFDPPPANITKALKGAVKKFSRDIECEICDNLGIINKYFFNPYYAYAEACSCQKGRDLEQLMSKKKEDGSKADIFSIGDSVKERTDNGDIPITGSWLLDKWFRYERMYPEDMYEGCADRKKPNEKLSEVPF